MTAGSGDDNQHPNDGTAPKTAGPDRASIRKLAKTIMDQSLKDPEKLLADQPPLNHSNAASANLSPAAQQQQLPQQSQSTGGSAQQPQPVEQDGQADVVVKSSQPQRLPGGGFQIPRKKPSSEDQSAADYPTVKPEPPGYSDYAKASAPENPAYQQSSVSTDTKRPARRGITQTALDMLFTIGNQLTGKGGADKPTVTPQLARAELEKTILEEARIIEQNPQQSLYQQPHEQSFEESEGAASEMVEPGIPHERVPRTLLDISLFDEIMTSSGKKQVVKAAEEAIARANEPVKPFIPIETKLKALPCAFQWQGEDSKERFRYCDLCSAQVYNLNGMELPQAEALIFSRENRTKPALYKRADGKYMTSNCPKAVKNRMNLIMVSAGALFIVVCLVAGMMLMPKPPKPVATNSSEVQDSASSDEGGSRRRPKEDSSDDSDDAERKIKTTTSGTQTGISPNSTSTSTTTGSNGGYGPSDNSDQSWQWQYDNKTPQPQTVPQSQPASAPAAPLRPSASQQAELTRLKEQLQDSQGKPDPQ